MNRKDAQFAINAGLVVSVEIVYSVKIPAWFIRFLGADLHPHERHLTCSRGPSEDLIRYYKTIDSAHLMLRNLGFFGPVAIIYDVR